MSGRLRTEKPKPNTHNFKFAYLCYSVRKGSENRFIFSSREMAGRFPRRTLEGVFVSKKELDEEYFDNALALGDTLPKMQEKYKGRYVAVHESQGF